MIDVHFILILPFFSTTKRKTPTNSISVTLEIHLTPQKHLMHHRFHMLYFISFGFVLLFSSFYFTYTNHLKWLISRFRFFFKFGLYWIQRNQLHLPLRFQPRVFVVSHFLFPCGPKDYSLFWWMYAFLCVWVSEWVFFSSSSESK